MREDALLTGTLESTIEPYSIAKIVGVKLCESYRRQFGRGYRSVIPTNLYGSHNNFHPENSHVIPALLRRFHEAVESGAEGIVIWSSGEPMREFLHVDDMAAASIYMMNLSAAVYGAEMDAMRSHINAWTGEDCTIREFAETIAGVTVLKGNLVFDRSKPDGTLRKLLGTTRLTALGRTPKIELRKLHQCW